MIKHQHKASPAVDLIIAALSFGLALFLWRRERAARAARRAGGDGRRAKGHMFALAEIPLIGLTAKGVLALS